VTGLATAFGSGAMTNSIADLDAARAILVIGSNTTEQHPVIGTRIRRAVRKGTQLIVADPRAIDLVNLATVHLRHRPGTDTALLNGLAQIILANGWEDREFIAARTENFDAWRAAIEKYTPQYVSEITGVREGDLLRAAKIYATVKPAAILYAMGITQHTSGHQNVLAIANLAMLTGNIGKPGAGVNPLRGQNNVQGACDMGALPNVFTAYQRVTDAQAREKFESAWGAPLPGKNGLTVVEMLNAAHAGTVKGMWIIGENPAMSDPDANHVREALEQLDFLVVQDIFMTETTRLADVILPAASFAEKDGTFTNTERRVQRVRRAVEPPGEARPDWWIVAELAKRVLALSVESQGTGDMLPETASRTPGTWDYAAPIEIFNELTALTPSYAGITYTRLENGGLQWPVPAADHPGTPILHREKFTRGLGLFSPVEYVPAAEKPDAEFPFILTTGRVLQQFHTGSMTHKVAGLNTLAPEERVEINSDDAAREGIRDRDWVTVSSRRGAARARARVTPRIAPGVVFMTFHYAEAPGNVLTNPALDPIAKIPEFKVCAVALTPSPGRLPLWIC
jgi:formate dehydrogenase alpha subunit